jgi:hypothetical protein
MQPAIFLLTGFPGTAKYTVARAHARLIEERGETVRVVDNHCINNPIFGLIGADGIAPLPRQAWDRVREVAGAVLRMVEELTPREWHLVFTAFINGDDDADYPARLAAIAEARGSRFVPVRLLCDLDEHTRRIVAPGRRERMKSVDPREPARLAALGPPYDPGLPNSLTIDITKRSAGEAATAILAHAASAGS